MLGKPMSATTLNGSTLNDFLYADVGIEFNGSGLTVLSMLARLGEDPWTQAGRWVRAPRSAAVKELAASIGRMPLDADGLRDAQATAARLILLLPDGLTAHSTRKAQPRPGDASVWRVELRRGVLLCTGILIWIVLTTAVLPAIMTHPGWLSGHAAAQPK
jgi:hypothetical protein